MSKKKHLTLEEIESLVNDPAIHEEFDDDNGPIDIVALPPDTIDVISDEEDIDEDNLIEQNIAEVPGHIEVHYHANDEAGEESLPVSTAAPKRKKRKFVSTWIKEREDFYVDRGDETEINERVSDIKTEFQDKTPVEVFEALFDEDVRKHIVQQSVIYASQNNRHDFLFSDDCLRKLIGFFLYTGYRSLPQEKLYWCEDEDIDDRFVRKCFTKNRYLEIKRYLHFNDNSTLGSNEPPRSFKIAPIIELMSEKFSKFGIFSKRLSIDEQMIQYYCRHFMKQFIRGKPIRFGYKNWAICCSSTGYCFNFDLYEGKQEQHSEANGLGASVVLNQVSKVTSPSNHIFYFDNYFTSFQLMKLLTEQNVSASGTVRINRTNKCPLQTDESLKKQERGFYDYMFDRNNDIFATVWKDNNNVKLLSNYRGSQPTQKVKRWSKQKKMQVTVEQPKCLAEYNSYMGGVDKMDWMINKYRIKIRGKKWYFPIFTYIIDMTVVNAHILYCMANDNIPLLEFRRRIVKCYMSTSSLSDPKRSGRPSLSKQAKKRVPDEIRKSNTGHYLERTEMGKQRKCAVCKVNVRKQCSRCDVGLHVDCFPKWHQ